MVSSIEKSLKKMLKRIDAKVVLIVLVVIAVVVVMSKTVEGFDWSMADKGYCESSSIAGQGSSCQANFSGIAGLGGQWGDACRGRGNDTDSCDLTLDDLYSNYSAGGNPGNMDASASSIAIAAQDSDLGGLTTTLGQAGNTSLPGDTKVCEYTTEVDLCGTQTKDTCESSGQGCSWRDCDALKTNSGNPFDGIKSVEEKRQLFKQLFNCWKKEHGDDAVFSGAGYDTGTSMLKTPIPVLTGDTDFATNTNFSLGSVTVDVDGTATALANDDTGTITASLFPQNWVDDMEDVIEECGYDYATDTEGAAGTGKVGFRLGSEHIPTGLQCLNYNEGLDSHCISIIKDQPLTGPGCGTGCDDDVVCENNHIPELGDIRNSGCDLDEQIAQVFSVLGRRGGNLSDAQRNQFAEFIMANTL